MEADRKINKMKSQAAAFKLFKRYGYKHPRDIELETLCMARKVFVSPLELKSSAARLTRQGENGVIRVRSGISEQTKRFCIAHELGHWEIHDSSQWYACSTNDLRDYRVSPEEVEANLFAAELLMPRFLVEDKFLKPEPSLLLAKDAAQEFNVSLTAAAIRMLNLTRHEAILVASKNGAIQWTIIPNDRYGVWFRRNQPLHGESLASCVSKGETIVGPHELDPEVWFPEKPANANFEISEESEYFPNFDFTLSIITIY